MKILDVFNKEENKYNTAIALGNFDGVHIGHQHLISTMVEKSKELNLKSSLLLFENHTKTVLDREQPKLITSQNQKLRIMESLGVDLIYKMFFNESVMKLSPQEFVKDILLDKLNCKAVVVGHDYRFGHKALGDASYLQELGRKFNFSVTIISPVYIDDKIISSTYVRELLLSGNIEYAKKMLGRNYSIEGKVVSGKKLGNKLGYPTANIEPVTNYIIPKYGVYSTNTIVNGKSYISASSIGSNPTFEDKYLNIESHILDFDENIYGMTIELELVKYLREEIKFHNLEDLKRQIQLDIREVKSRY